MLCLLVFVRLCVPVDCLLMFASQLADGDLIEYKGFVFQARRITDKREKRKAQEFVIQARGYSGAWWR